MSKGYSLHIGLNKVDHKHYGNIPELKAAVNDAIVWKKFAIKSGYAAKSLHDKQATSGTVKKILADYAKKVKPGDILLLTYAGHGGEMQNDKGGGFDNERNDQTWCLYDRQLLDDELYELMEAFKEGTRILVVSDSCHSGTVVRALDEINFSQMLATGVARSAKSRGFASRKLPQSIKQSVDEKYRESVYKPIQKNYRNRHQGAKIKASVKLLAACQDDEETLDGEKNGIFTEALMELVHDKGFGNANCEMLIAAVSKRYFFPKPNFFQYGSIIPGFDKGFPFTINIANATKITGTRLPDLSENKSRKIRTFVEQADLRDISKSAELLIEITGEINGNPVGGNDVEITNDIVKGNQRRITVELPAVPYQHAWSAAHALQTELKESGIKAVVEPILSIVPAQKERISREGDANNPDYIKEWPPSLLQGKIGIGWHLDDEHSQLSKAYKTVIEKNPNAHVRVAHFDTGYIEGHVALPPHLNKGLARSFIKKENPNQAIDKTESGQDGHGLGTMTLLAGNRVTKADTFDEFEGFIGGAPLADLVPMRISDSVVIMNDANFCDAIDYAIEQNCDVLSMSMAGKPSRRMARAVNDAYEAGIVMVTAASNCWYKGPGAILPKCVLFPAAFKRVIAATGAMYDHKPYDVNFLQQGRFNITTKYMQGSWGPASRMTRALAGYTPNTPWASSHHKFVRSGGGTSSATPQIAAAAALWIAHHRAELESKGYYEEGNKWKKVEAVRYALFASAAREEVFDDWQKYYGNGIMRAYDALDVPVADADKLVKAEKAESSFLGLSEMLASFFKRRKLFRSKTPKPTAEALATELLDLLQTDPPFYSLFSNLNLSSKKEATDLINDKEFRKQVVKSPYASDYLKEVMVR